MNNELIVLEQLPIIKATLENLSVEIKEKVDRANSLIVNEETVKEVKQVRADLNKEFNELESQKKAVKNAIMAKYDEFEEIYKENVSNLYKDADTQLKGKIDSVENQLKQEKIDELELFAKQHIEFNDLDHIISFEDIPLNVTLSASMKFLKEQVLAFINKTLEEIKLIELEEYKDEILVEYKNTLDFAKSKLAVVQRHKQLEELHNKQKEVQLQIDDEARIVEKVEEITAPKEIIEDEDILKVTFTITTTKSNLVKLKEFLKENEIDYE